MDLDAIRARLEQVDHAALCIHSDCVRCVDDIAKPRDMSIALAADVRALLEQVRRLQNDLLIAEFPGLGSAPTPETMARICETVREFKARSVTQAHDLSWGIEDVPVRDHLAEQR